MRMNRVLLVLLFCSGGLFASPQWLQYRTSGQSRDIVRGPMAFHRPEKDKPSIKLPELQSASPVFVKWKTPMDAAGFRWMVFDKKQKYGACNIVYFDTNGNGCLDDDSKIEGVQVNEYEVEFYKVPVLFTSPDGPITYHLNLRFYSYDADSTYVYASTGCWYEGTIEIAGQKQRCILVDSNVNGSFNDKSNDFDSDQICIGPDDNILRASVGNYVEYKESLYRVEIARDGAFMELTPAPDVAYGTVLVPKEICEFSAGGMNGMYTRHVKDGQLKLPEGKYRVRDWTIKRSDDKGTEWSLEGSYPDKNERFTVSRDSTAELNQIGEPVFSKIDARFKEGSFYFNQAITGQSGERISLLKSRERMPAPKIHIRNKTGQYDRTFSLEYG